MTQSHDEIRTMVIKGRVTTNVYTEQLIQEPTQTRRHHLEAPGT